MLLTRYGTMTAFGIEHIDTASLHDARHLCVGSYFIQTGLQTDIVALFSAARDRGQTTSLDLGWDPSEIWDAALLERLLPHVSLVFPNKVGLAHVTRTPDIGGGLATLNEMGIAKIALKLGDQGAILSPRDTRLRHGGFAADVIDTTGAGDAFNAGFLYGMLRNLDDLDCLAHANACGTLTASATGGTGGLMSLQQVKARLRQIVTFCGLAGHSRPATFGRGIGAAGRPRAVRRFVRGTVGGAVNVIPSTCGAYISVRSCGGKPALVWTCFVDE